MPKRFCYGFLLLSAVASAQAEPAARVYAFGERPMDADQASSRARDAWSILDRFFASMDAGRAQPSVPPEPPPPSFVAPLGAAPGLTLAGDGDLATGFDATGEPPDLTAQLHGFAARGGRFGARDLPVVWAGAGHHVFAASLYLPQLLTGGWKAAGDVARPVAAGVVRNVAAMGALGALRAALAQLSRDSGMNIHYVDADAAQRTLPPPPAASAGPQTAPFRAAAADDDDGDSTASGALSAPFYFTPPTRSGSSWSLSGDSDGGDSDGPDDDLPPPPPPATGPVRPLAVSAALRQRLAEIIAGQVTAGAGVARPGHLAAQAADGFSREVTWRAARRLAPAAPSQLAGPTPFVFASGGGARERAPAAGDQEAFSASRHAFAGGAGLDFDQRWRAGLIAGGDIIAASGRLARTQGHALHAGVAGAFSDGGWFGAATAAVHVARFNARRRLPLSGDGVTAAPKGAGHSIAVEGGYRLQARGGITVAPVAGVRHASMRMDAWREQGPPLVIQTVASHGSARTVANAGVQVSGLWRAGTAAGPLEAAPFADLRVAVASGGGGRRVIRSSFEGTPELVIRNGAPAGREICGEMRVGLGVTLGDFIRNDLALSATLTRGGRQEHGVASRLTLAF